MAQGGPQGPRGPHKGPAHKGMCAGGSGKGWIASLYLISKWEQRTGALWHSRSTPWWGPVGIFDVGGLLMDITVQGSPWGDALQQADADAGIESFSRWTFVEIWPFSWYAIYLL